MKIVDTTRVIQEASQARREWEAAARRMRETVSLAYARLEQSRRSTAGRTLQVLPHGRVTAGAAVDPCDPRPH